MDNHPSKSQVELTAELDQLRREVSRLQALVAKQSDRATPPEGEGVLRTLAAQLPMVIFALDCNGIITDGAGAGLKSLGLQPGGLVGRAALEAFAHVPEIQRYLARALDGDPLQGESGPESFEIGSQTFNVWHAQLRDQEGNLAGVTGIIIDVTQRRRGEGHSRTGRNLMEQMLRSHERDRQLIAYEIHDGLVQDATGALMQLDTLLQSEHLPSET
ncbi:hypothetical protein LCGC14_2742670, partial [marine sediment metagenome]